MNQDQLTDKINKLENNVAELKGMIQQLLLDKQDKTFQIKYSNGTNTAGWDFESFGGNIIGDDNYYCNSTYSINEDTD